ncbi:SPOR domain-containing protein [Paraburkholderia acidipaludis]|uniref:SPOR domain-containing protein n=1 Tax=Paraburkholderia acidipaludis TaxID=660537 RepID=UPI00048453A0|nr:SPOR domain-containing protein [Paraburkholderia acidipaludis]
MGIFSFGKKDDAAPRRRGAEAGSGRRSSQSTRVERRSRRPDRSADAEAMLLDPTLPEKQRARRRLVGAIALVVAAIVILPMVLDSHPKPVTDDIAIDIPSRPTPPGAKAAARDDADSDDDTQAGVAPDNPGASNLATVAPGASAAPAQGATSTQSAATAGTKAATQTQTQTTAAAKTSAAPTSAAGKPVARPAAPSANMAVASNQNTNAAGSGDSGDNSSPPPTPPGSRFAVQLGSFSNATAASNWVTKLKAAGVPAYTEQRKQPDGSTRTLLRAGPFPDRAAASEAIAKVRGAGLMAGSNGAAD